MNICGEPASQQEVNYAGNCIDSISDQIRSDLSQLFKTSTLLTVKSADDIKIVSVFLAKLDHNVCCIVVIQCCSCSFVVDSQLPELEAQYFQIANQLLCSL